MSAGEHDPLADPLPPHLRARLERVAATVTSAASLRPRRGATPPMEVFVAAWNTGAPKSAIAQALGLRHDGVRRMLRQARAEGLKLKERRGRSKAPTGYKAELDQVWNAVIK